MKEDLFKDPSQFIGLTSEEKEAFEKFNRIRKHKKGDILLKEGQLAKEYYFVIKGCLRSYYLIDGNEKTTEFYLEEESIAPESLVDQKPSEYFIICEEDTNLLATTLEMEKQAFKEFPKLEFLCRSFTEKELSKKQSSISKYIKSTAEERYLDLQKNRPQLLQRVPQYHIASFIGVKPETLSRIRRKMKKKSD